MVLTMDGWISPHAAYILVFKRQLSARPKCQVCVVFIQDAPAL